jgi:hypothetical protein
MDRFKDRLVIGAVVLTLGLVGMFMNAHQVTAAVPPTAGPNVTITGPFPLPVSGSTTVSGSVSITGTPNVTVTNPLLPVRDAAVFTPFEGSCLDFVSSVIAGCEINVPTGNQLVVQAISAFAEVDAGLVPVNFTLQQTKNGASSGGHVFAMTFQAPINDGNPANHILDAFIASQPLTWAFDPAASGASCGLIVNTRPHSNIGNVFSCTVTGYLVPKP